jgi:SRSO17 transposase
LGKVEMSQVGVRLSYVNLKVAQGFWSWIEGRLFLPEAWFGTGRKTLGKRLGIPKGLGFKPKVELAWEMIEAAITPGVPFEIVGLDTLYGRSGWLRAQLRNAGALYMAEVPVDTELYPGKTPPGYPRAPLKVWSPPIEGARVEWGSGAGG